VRPLYARPAAGVPVFDKVFARPDPALGDPSFGRTTSEVIGQDSGDVFAMLTLGYEGKALDILRVGEDGHDGPGPRLSCCAERRRLGPGVGIVTIA
jgi:hypothetical protein